MRSTGAGGIWRGLASEAHPHAPDMVWRVRQQGEVTGALDGLGQGSLVLGAAAGLAARVDAAAVGEEAAEKRGVLIVDGLHVLGAHDADPAPAASAPYGPLLIAAGAGSGRRRRRGGALRRRGFGLRLAGDLLFGFVYHLRSSLLERYLFWLNVLSALSVLALMVVGAEGGALGAVQEQHPVRDNLVAEALLTVGSIPGAGAEAP